MNYKKSLENQDIKLTDVLLNKPKTKYLSKVQVSFIVGLGIFLMWVVIVWLFGVKSKTPIQKPCANCHNRKVQMTGYFKSRKNPHPELMAEAVLKTSTPRLLAAIAVAGEKNTPYTARKTGYKKRHSGAWQVSEKDWGKVPYTPAEQAKQAEGILMELTDNKPLRQALSHYGGDSTDAYQQRVINEFRRVP